jgi:hypothetical protein
VNTQDGAILQSILDKAWMQAEQQAYQELEGRLFDLDGRYGCLNRKYTRLAQVSQSQMNLIDEIVNLCKDAAGMRCEDLRVRLLEIQVIGRTGAATLREALEAPIVIRKE